MAHVHHLPGALEPVQDMRKSAPIGMRVSAPLDLRTSEPAELLDICTSLPSLTPSSSATLESLHFRRASYHKQSLTSDTSQVRQQLERIATLLEDGFRRTEERRKLSAQLLSVQENAKPKRRRESHCVAAGIEFTPPSTAPNLPHINSSDIKVNANQSAPKLRPIIGGEPITEQLARRLRKVVYGSTVHSFSKEWRVAGFHYHFHETPYPYGLVTEKNGSRGLILCVQAFIIRHMVFKYKTKDEIFSRRTLEPTTNERTQALVRALSNILWQAGNKEHACVCLPSDNVSFHTNDLYRADGITERMHLFYFKSYPELETFIKRYLPYFDTKDGIHGCIMFLYSVVLSKTVERVEREMQDKRQLVTDNEELSQCLVNLILTGHATPYLHNDTLIYDDDGELLSKPLVGIPHRNDIGLLFWNKEEHRCERTQVGSMLKTPRFPIWVTLLNGTFGLVFSINPDLVCDWRVEHRFQLHYFSGLKLQIQAVILMIDTRFGRKTRAKTARSRRDELTRIPAVEQAILTKWFGAEVNWNGVMPFV